MKKVKSITEAFSMQPLTLEITKENHRSHFYKENDIKEIKLESREIGNSEYIRVYKGYNFEDELIFEYIAKSVNVHYF